MNFEQVVKIYENKIKNQIKYKVKNRNDHDDIYQEALIKIWKGLPKFEGKSNISTWIHKVTRNVIIRYFENCGESAVNIDDLNDKNLPLSLKEFSDPQSILERVEKEQRLEELVQSCLTIDELNVYELRYDECMSVKEIAKKLNKREGTVLQTLSRMQKKLCQEQQKKSSTP